MREFHKPPIQPKQKRSLAVHVLKACAVAMSLTVAFLSGYAVDAASDPSDLTRVAAPEVLDILALKENGFGGFEKKHLTVQTEVRHSHFSLIVPQGWTVAVLPATVRYAANLTVTPTGEVVDDPTYLGIHTLQGRVEMSIEQKRLAWEKTLEPGDKLSIVEWQGIPWVLREYQCESDAIEWRWRRGLSMSTRRLSWSPARRWSSPGRFNRLF